MVLASNVWSRPLGWWQSLTAAKKRGCKIIVIDTRNTKTAQFADIHLAPKVGTDAALAMGIIRVLVKENLYDKAFVDKWCHGFEELKNYCESFTPERTEEITGVPAQKIIDAARMYADGPGSFSLTSQSLTHNTNASTMLEPYFSFRVFSVISMFPAVLVFRFHRKGFRPAGWGCSLNSMKPSGGTPKLRRIDVLTKTLFCFGMT